MLSFAALEALVLAGGRPTEGELIRALRSSACPGRFVEELAGCGWAIRSQRLLPLLVRHPACPRPFAWEAIPHLGWHDLVEVARYPRTSPPVRRQVERRLLDRIPQLTGGERVALARRATRGVIVGLLSVPEPGCIRALLDNPQLTETDTVRLLTVNESGECLAAVVRHRTWGQSRTVVKTALRQKRLPLGLALGLLVSLSSRELAELADSPDVSARIRVAAAELVAYRSRGA